MTIKLYFLQTKAMGLDSIIIMSLHCKQLYQPKCGISKSNSQMSDIKKELRPGMLYTHF